MGITSRINKIERITRTPQEQAISKVERALIIRDLPSHLAQLAVLYGQAMRQNSYEQFDRPLAIHIKYCLQMRPPVDRAPSKVNR